MPIRRYTVYLEILGPAVFYHWDYDPPVSNCGGGLGRLLPGGLVYGISYDELRSLGNGTHTLEFDETKRGNVGLRPVSLTQDDRLFEQLRFELFAERRHSCVAGEPLSTILLAMTPRNVDRIVPLLTKTHLEGVETYALEIAATKVEREQQGHSIFYSGGGSILIPDENLAAIRGRFSSEARRPLL